MRKIIYTVMLLLCMSIIGCQKEESGAGKEKNNYPLVTKITSINLHSSWSIALEYDSIGRITKIKADDETITFDYEQYSNGEGQILLTEDGNTAKCFMKGGLCYECKFSDSSLDTEKFEYNGNHLISWDGDPQFTWVGDIIVRREGESFGQATYEYGENNPFAEQQFNMTEFLLYGLSGNTINLLGFCGIEPQKLVTKELGKWREASYEYKYENGLITEVTENLAGRTYYIEYN